MADYQKFPQELKNIAHWCVYRLTPDPKNPDRMRKVPFQSRNPKSGASSTDPQTWSTFEEAIDSCAANGMDGIGWFFTPPYFGFDLDHVIDENGVTQPWAIDFLKRYSTYTELSPSKTGYHGIGHGRVPTVDDPKAPGILKKPAQVKTQQVEVYGGERYFTVTGDHVEGLPREITRFDEDAVKKLYADALVADGSKKIEAKTEAASKQLTRLQRFNLLSLGKWQELHASQSEADLEYCVFLAKAHEGDVDSVLADFKASALYRSPAQGKHEGYPLATAKKAVEKWLLDPNRKRKRAEDEVDIDPASWPLEFTPLCDWNLPDPVEIVSDILIEGGVHVWAGLFESYKTMAALETSSAILEQRPVFDYFKVARSHEILYLCPDMPHRLFLKYARCFGLDKKPGFRALSPNSDLFIAIDDPRLAAAVKDRILFLDTMLDYARIQDAFRSGEWIDFFQKLRRLINVHGCVAIVLLAHPTKAGARNNVIDATEFLKDSVTFGGKIDVGFAYRKVDMTSKVFIQRIKGRGWERPISFTVATHDEDGQSHISRGRFPICDKPEEKTELGQHLQTARSGPKSKATEDKLDRIRQLLRNNPRPSNREIGDAIGVSKDTVGNWIERYQLDQDPTLF